MAVPSPSYRAKLNQGGYLLRSPLGEFWLPVAPQSIRARQPTRVAYMSAPQWAEYDVQGLDGPEWDIDGQFLISRDGYAEQRKLERFIRAWAEENRKRGLAETALAPLEWHDFFAAEHWEVYPVTVPMGERSAQTPLTERYSLRLKGIRPIGAAAAPPDPVGEALRASPDAVAQQFCPYEGIAI